MTSILNEITSDSTVSAGLDSGMVGMICEATNQAKEIFAKWGLGEKLNRFYPAIPFVVAAGLEFLMGKPVSGAVQEAVRLGLLSNLAWHGVRVTIKGK